MVSPMTSHLTLIELPQKVKESQDHSDFEALYLVKEQLDHMLLLDINKKAYIGSPVTLSRLTLGDLERSNSRPPTFRVSE